MLSPYMLWSQASSCLFAVYRYQRFRARGKGEQRDPRGDVLAGKDLCRPPSITRSWIRRWIEEPRPSDGYYSTGALRLLAADFIA
jgi:hypothetical protein